MGCPGSGRGSIGLVFCSDVMCPRRWGPSSWPENRSEVVILDCRFGLCVSLCASCVVVLPGRVFRIDRWYPMSNAGNGGLEVVGVCGIDVVFDFQGVGVCCDHQNVDPPPLVTFLLLNQVQGWFWYCCQEDFHGLDFLLRFGDQS